MRHLQNAPITEAIIDFRIHPTKGFHIEKFLDFKAQLLSNYPVMEPRKLIESRFEIKKGEPNIEITKREAPQGYWFKSSDGLEIVQFRVDGFTFNRLKPYTRWEDIFPKAWRLWETYTQSGAAEFVTRIATRFINRLTFRTPVYDLATYLTTPPHTPEGISGNIAGFLTRVVVNTPEKGLNANITHALEEGTNRSSVVVILDIDAYKQKQFEIGDSLLPTTFNSLHDLKNSIFFSTITEEAARLFE
ncbi:MAG: TIGR04255 family protein [Candidatus Binatia bacterium]